MLLLIKLTLVPALVASVTLASRRWGLRVGGILTALPMVAGPTLVFYAIEQGPAFAAAAARTAMLGIAASAGFAVAYAWTARRWPWFLSLPAGWAAVAAVAAPLYRLRDLAGAGEFAIAIGALVVARRLIPAPPAPSAAPPGPPRWDVPLRMAASAAAVVLFTGIAAVLGARLSGFVSALPVVTMILAVFTHAQCGHASLATFLRGLLRGLHTFAVLCIVYATTLGLGWPWPAAFATALGAQLALQAALLRFDENFR